MCWGGSVTGHQGAQGVFRHGRHTAQRAGNTHQAHGLPSGGRPREAQSSPSSECSAPPGSLRPRGAWTSALAPSVGASFLAAGERDSGVKL